MVVREDFFLGVFGGSFVELLGEFYLVCIVFEGILVLGSCFYIEKEVVFFFVFIVGYYVYL